MNDNKTYHQDSDKPRLRLDDIPKPAMSDPPEGYFEHLEHLLLSIPDKKAPSRMVHMRPWIIGIASAAAISLLLMFYGGLFKKGDPPIGTDAAYAYLSDYKPAYDQSLDIALSEALLDDEYFGEDVNVSNVWSDTESFLEDTDEETLIEYLDDHSDLDDLLNEF